MTERRDPNTALADVIAEAGCTYEALARAIRTVAAEAGEELHTSRSAVHSWVAGGTPSGRTRSYIAEALTRRVKRKVTLSEIGLGCAGIGEALGADPLASATDLGRFVMLRRRNFLNAAFATAAVGLPLAYDHEAVAATLRAAERGGSVGAGEVATVRQLTETFRSADDRLGGGHGLTTVTAYLTDTVIPILEGRFASESLRRSAFGAAATLACLVGWKHHDLGREGAAQRYYLLGFQLACESDPDGHGAWMMRALTHQALDLGHPASCVGLAEEALRRASGKVDRQTEALLLVTCARAYGACGEGPKAAAALLSAEDAMLAGHDQVPPYAAASGPVVATVASHTGKTLTEMKDHRAAEKHYRAALRGRVPGTYQRVHGLTLVNLGKSVAAQHRHEEAVALWNRSLDFMDGVVSDRSRKEIRSIRSTAAGYGKRGIPGARALDQRANELLRAQA
ncbi:tetratricopeptide repeat protein (plasmid) [Streptomyces sp. NBC_00536]|uniref:tetratricopeptide repeat protein n=1 Tax=Streptomyces sp. NBC_00536 TaxID=2975769 RepID=UPI002E8008AF|nr:tetratricopeptide repeat protein [Streptomyces sp. NBC_00536]WUC84172.1 tetratricopeptide repeat protein [Streptomyces sp. NBC_00536]